MSTRLSSGWTPVFKYLFPSFWIGAFGLGTLWMWIGGGAEPDWMKYVFLAIWLAGSAFILWLTGRLRSVRLEGETLLVGGLGAGETIPLHRVVGVREFRRYNPRTIELTLEPGAASVQRVVFMAPVGLLWQSTEHPLVADLRRAVEGSRSNRLRAGV